MATKKIAETDLILAWALYVFCNFALALGIGYCISTVFALIFNAIGVSSGILVWVVTIANFFATLPISYLFFRIFVKHFIVKKLEAEALPDGKLPE